MKQNGNLQKLRNKLEQSYTPEPFSGCWIFSKGEVTRHGYGLLITDGRRDHRKRKQAHRLSYQVFVGSIPKNQCVLHKCDTRLCINPDHLFLGTRFDNYNDSRNKGRNTRGEIQGSAKLTDHDISVIRKQYCGGRTLKDLAEEYKVHFSTIARVVNRQTWNHVIS